MMVKSQEEKRISHNKAQQKYELKLNREKEAKKERQGFKEYSSVRGCGAKRFCRKTLGGKPFRD
jgi:hypothetical protein